MASFACPNCGSELIQKREPLVRIRIREVLSWNEDGTPDELDEGFYLDEGVDGEVHGAGTDEVLGGKPYECGQCGIGFTGPEELERVD